MLAANKIFIDYLHMTLKKLHVKYNPLHLEIFKAKVEKVQKNALIIHNYATKSLLIFTNCVWMNKNS